MILLDELVVIDVADRDRPFAPDAAQQPAYLGRVALGIPALGRDLVLAHVGQEEADVARGHIAQRMRPVFEHGFVDRLRVPQVGAAVGGNAGIEHVVVAALDDVDGVNLHIAQLLDRRLHCGGTCAEGRLDIELLRGKPEPARLPRAEHHLFHSRNLAGFCLGKKA
jgi:hypothetical protein